MPDRSSNSSLFDKIIAIWRKYTTGSTDRRIFGAAAAIALMTLLVKLIATIKEIVVAWRFGTNENIDSFAIAWIVPSFAIGVIANSLNSAFIPTYIKVREEQGQAAAQKLLSGTMVVSIVLLLIATISIGILSQSFLPQLVPNASPERVRGIWWLLLWVSPTIVAVGISTIWSAVMNAGEKFAFAAILPLLTPGITIFFLLLLPQLQAGTLVAGLCVGSAIELTCLAIALKRQKVNPLPRWYGWTPELKHVLTQFMPTIIGQVIMTSTAIVDRAMASTLGEGSVAALNYGERLISLPINLLVTALGTAVIPYFSRSVAAGNWQEVRQTVIKYSAIVFALSLPICAFFYFLAEPMTQILFERGSFSRADTILVAKIQAMYVLQIPFYLAAILTVRVMTALDLNLMMGLGCVINFAVNIILNYVFMEWMGLPGIALSTGFVYLVSWLYLLGCAYIKLNDEIFISRWLDRHRYQKPPSDRFVDGEKNTFIKSALF